LKYSIIILFLLIAGIPELYSQSDILTKVVAYVTDETGTLTNEQINALETKLINFENETSNQVVVYMMSTTGDIPLEEKSWEIAEKNKIGQKDKDNGVLLFVAKDDRQLRIEVGYGLEGALPDALASQIIRKEITPYFKKGQYYEGVNAGVDAIMNATKGEYEADKKFVQRDDDDSPAGPAIGCCGLPILTTLALLFFGIFFIFNIFRKITGGKIGGRRSGGIFFPGGGWGGGGSSWGGGGGFSGGGGSFGGGGSSGSW
jgi:uncharacterized protein